MSRANLSFWLTDTPTPIADLPTAEQLLVDASKDFQQLYIKCGVRYKVFVQQSLTSRSTFAVNEKVLIATINHLVAVYSRVYDVLISHRKRVIEAFSRKSTFDEEAALLLLDDYELRSKSSKQDIKQNFYPDKEIYERLANCANRFGVFMEPIEADTLIALRDGSNNCKLKASNMQRAIFFLSLLGVLRLLPYQWKKTVCSTSALVNPKTGKSPSNAYLIKSSERKKPRLYLQSIEPIENPTRGDFYEKVTASVLFCVKT